MLFLDFWEKNYNLVKTTLRPQKRMLRSSNCAKNYCQIPNYITEVAAPCFTVTGETFKITHKCSFDSGYL